MKYEIKFIPTICCGCGLKLKEETQAVYKNKKIAYCVSCWESY